MSTEKPVIYVPLDEEELFVMIEVFEYYLSVGSSYRPVVDLRKRLQEVYEELTKSSNRSN